MAKELKIAQQLSDMIVSVPGVSEVEVSVRKDHAYGWQPTVVSCPGDSIGFQRRVEEIANRLCFHSTCGTSVSSALMFRSSTPDEELIER